MNGPPPGWLADPALDPLWEAVRTRLERNGVRPEGTLLVPELDRAARHAVAGLIGRPVTTDRVRLDLAGLDEALRQRSGVGGLVAVLEALGGPVRNRVAERSARAADREAPFDVVRSWLAAHPELGAAAWVEPWLAGLRQAGLVARTDSDAASEAMRRALDVLVRLIGDERVPTARTELAALATGDAHALDDGTLACTLVLRALAVDADQPVPSRLSERRLLWERYGVSADAVSSTCLVLGLQAVGDSALAQRLRAAAQTGDPLHITGWDLRRGDQPDAVVVPPATGVLVCENPRVLEAVAERFGGEVPVVCTAGVPGLVTLQVLRSLAACGARLRYHGDLDWAGLSIANRLVAQVGVQPWRMAAADYRAAARPDGPVLEGRRVEASWDRALAEAMDRGGVAVHEEAVLPDLLAELGPDLSAGRR
ncbi:MAG TPA: TIGR02679 family protein [Motilibacteraceae bacterium]|nr:TIGR02679 family protein [Motilibacteraceae bacterium]